MSLAEKIKSLETEIVSAKDQMVGLVNAAETENRDLSEVESEEVDTLKNTVEAKEKSLKAYKSAEQTLAKSVGAPSVVKSNHLGTVKSRKGEDMLFVKMATAAFVAHAQQKSIEAVAAESFSADRELQTVVKEMVAPALTNVNGWGAELTKQGYADFLDALRPQSFYAQLAGVGTQIQFGGLQSISLPSQNTIGDLSGSFVSEGNLIPVKRTSFAAKTLHRYKMGVISHFSKEMASASIPAIQGLISNQMVVDTANAIDLALISANPAVANKAPAGLLNGVTLGASSGTTAADILADLKTLVTPIIAANGNSSSIVLLMNPLQELGLSFATTATGSYVFRDQLANGRLNGYRVIVSNTIPAGTVIALDASSFASAFDTPEFKVSDTATLVTANDVDPAPNLVDQADMVPVGAPIVSLFQQELIAVRMTMPLSWVMRRDGFVTGLTGVNW